MGKKQLQQTLDDRVNVVATTIKSTQRNRCKYQMSINNIYYKKDQFFSLQNRLLGQLVF